MSLKSSQRQPSNRLYNNTHMHTHTLAHTQLIQCQINCLHNRSGDPFSVAAIICHSFAPFTQSVWPVVSIGGSRLNVIRMNFGSNVLLTVPFHSPLLSTAPSFCLNGLALLGDRLQVRTNHLSESHSTDRWLLGDPYYNHFNFRQIKYRFSARPAHSHVQVPNNSRPKQSFAVSLSLFRFLFANRSAECPAQWMAYDQCLMRPRARRTRKYRTKCIPLLWNGPYDENAQLEIGVCLPQTVLLDKSMRELQILQWRIL